MKKKSLLFIIALAIFGICEFINPLKVSALYNETLVETPIDDVYYTRRGGGKPYMSAQYNTYTMNGKVVYCIEPGVDITIHSYVGYDGLSASPYDSATNKKIELIGHYGYDYPGHQTLRYRMATQSLIWEETGGQIVEFWTEASGYGDFINLNYERNQIMALVNKHYDKPSFNGTSVKGVIGQEFQVTDLNNMLSEYEIYNSSDFNIRIDGNTIYATPLKVGDLTLSFVRKHYDNNTTIVYHGTDGASQKMGYFRFSDPVVASINVYSVGGDVAINKLDNDTQSSQSQGAESTLKGAVYGIYDYYDNLITKITTDENGYAKSETLPDLGDYYLKEISPSKGYNLDTTKYYFNIDDDLLHPTFNVYEDIIDRDIEINKYFANPDTGILIPEKSIKFGIYDINGKEVSIIETDNQGVAKINLVYGTYTFKQLNATSGHEKVEDFTISVNENSPKLIKYSLSNAPIQAKLKVVKTDKETGLIIPMKGITFKIKDKNTNEYVCQQITYPNVENICEFKTDDNGIFYTPFELSYGSYILEEVDQKIDGYLWNKQGVEFVIDETSNFTKDSKLGIILEIDFSNSQVKGQIDINKQGEEIIIENGTYSYNKINLKGATFEVRANEDIIISGYKYYSKGDLVDTLVTDENGYASLKNIHLGKYTLQEISSSNGNMLDSTIYEIELTYKDQYTEIIINTSDLENYIPKGTLEFTKIDIADSKPIPNTTIEVYTEDDKLIYTGVTDENGKITIENLFVGKFYILEKDCVGYVINEEKMYFEILENGEVVKATMTNEKIKVPSTGLSNINWEQIGYISLIITGIGFVIYGITRKKK